ncbi:MAG: chemotaxis protein CheX [Proteobacteria bacterium]|nr:MAG: chemotaxis protein CheX [Pseudomonadota bacterium]
MRKSSLICRRLCAGANREKSLALFELTKADELITCAVHGTITAEIAEEMARSIYGLVALEPRGYSVVLDMQAHDIEYRSFRVFGGLATELKKTKSQMFVLTKNRELTRMINLEGMAAILKPIESLAALNPCAGPLRIDVNFINPFIEGTIQTLGVQCQTPIAPDRPARKGQGTDTFRTDIAGIIGITSPVFTGSIAICFPESMFLLLMSRMLGEPCPEITKDMEDGAGEILNMIYGHAKKVLNEKGFSFEKAIPTVVRAPGLILSQINEQGTILLPFRAEEGSFHMEISVRQGAG